MKKIAILDDYQDCVRNLDCFKTLTQYQVDIFHDNVKDTGLLADRLSDAEAIVLTRERTRITAPLLDRLPRLRLISQTGRVSGHIDIAACTDRGIAVTDGEGHATPTAELTWCLMLASRRHLVSEANRLKQGLWQGHLGQQLRGQRLGIWSYGRIGRQVAAYGKAFGMHTWVWGGEHSTSQARADGFEVAPSKEAFFEQSDILSLHLRLSDRTRGVVGPADLARMKSSALIVNTSRAELIQPGALEAALRAGKPGYAAVDVFEQEPLVGTDHPLLGLPNALCTPHIGFVEKDNYESYYGQAFDNIVRFFKGDVRGVVNPEVLGR